MKQKLLSIKKATLKKAFRYLLATLFTLWIGSDMILHNSFPEWYFLYFALTGIMGVLSYGIAEKIYKKNADWTSFKKYPMTSISIIITDILGILAFIQLVTIVR